jgi:hypothetical protein
MWFVRGRVRSTKHKPRPFFMERLPLMLKAEGQKENISLPSQNYQLLLQMINGGWTAQMIHVAAKLGIADLLADGPKPSADLAQTTGTHAPSLYRMLRALASLGIFAEDSQGRFSLTPLAEPLRREAPDSVRGWTIYVGSPQSWRSWEELEYSVTTGLTAFPHVWGMQNWEYRANHPEANADFNQAMTSAAYWRIGPVIAAYDFSGINTLVDVGGGQGAFIARILSHYPAMRGILFDLPHVTAGAARMLQETGVGSRCEIVGGSFLESVPGGGDAYLLSRVIHDWNDEQAALILKNCRQAMGRTSKLLLVEAVIPPGNTPHPGKLTDINMLVSNSGGRERTEAEFGALLDAAGFRLTRIVPTPGDVSVIEGMPA